MKDINNLTIKEFELFSELMQMDEPDVFGIFEIFGLDPSNMKFDEFDKNWRNIQKMNLSTRGVKKIYNINGKRFKACLNPLKLTAGQFVDFQSYLSSGVKLERILSVFLLPQDKSWFFGKYSTKKYNTKYDIFEVQNYLYSNMTIGEANELSNFFLNWSTVLLKTMRDYSVKKMLKLRNKQKEINSLG